MKLRRIIASLLPSLLAATLALGSAACGKDKPAEEAAAVPEPTSDEKPADEAKPDEEKPAETPDTAEGDKAKEGENEVTAREPGKRQTRRDRLNGRRPPPIRTPKNDPGAAGDPKPLDGETVKLAGDPTTDTATPPATDTPPVVETPPAPNPTPPPVEVTPTPEPAGEVHASAIPIDASTIMPIATVAEITAMQLRAGAPLQGIAIVPGYGSIFYAAQEAAKFGVALQVWQDASKRESDDRFRRMRLQYPNAEDVTVLQPSKAFYSYFDKLQSLTWVEPTKRMVISVTCGEAVCNQDQLVRLAKSARERLP